MQIVADHSSQTNPSAMTRGDVASLVRGRSVAAVGRLASMSEQEFVELIESMGGHVISPFRVPVSLSLLVIGEAEWPLDRSGMLWHHLRTARVRQHREGRRLTIITERLFLEALNLSERADATHRLYTIATIIDLLGVTRNQIRAWVRAGLIAPVRVDRGVWYFDFRQVSAAKTICELLARPGVTVASLRRQLLRLREWMPEAEAPLSQLSAIESNGSLLVRLARGELAADDGQLHFDFENPQAEAPSLRLVPGPQTPGTAEEWHEQGIEQEHDGFVAEAVASYREALLVGGPNPQLVFDLAHALHELGKTDEAIERYRQVVEIDNQFADAWNNLGILLSDAGQANAACEAFGRALAADPTHLMARYNLADTLDLLRRTSDAAQHWREYLKSDPTSERGNFARKRLRAISG